MAKTYLNYRMQQFRRQFRDWYGGLSVLELSVNSSLIHKIKKIESLINEMADEKTDY